MKLKVFSIPAVGDESAEEAVNHFMASKRIAQVDRQLVSDAAGSYWTVCIGYWDAASGQTPRPRKGRIDYREVLDEKRFREYAALRDWRKTAAESEGVPLFSIFSNEQLANIVQLEAANLASVSSIDGIGKSKLEQYAAAALAVLTGHRETSGNADA